LEIAFKELKALTLTINQILPRNGHVFPGNGELASRCRISWYEILATRDKTLTATVATAKGCQQLKS
jgi:hypothetical protein